MNGKTLLKELITKLFADISDPEVQVTINIGRRWTNIMLYLKGESIGFIESRNTLVLLQSRDEFDSMVSQATFWADRYITRSRAENLKRGSKILCLGNKKKATLVGVIKTYKKFPLDWCAPFRIGRETVWVFKVSTKNKQMIKFLEGKNVRSVSGFALEKKVIRKENQNLLRLTTQY